MPKAGHGVAATCALGVGVMAGSTPAAPTLF